MSSPLTMASDNILVQQYLPYLYCAIDSNFVSLCAYITQEYHIIFLEHSYSRLQNHSISLLSWKKSSGHINFVCKHAAHL